MIYQVIGEKKNQTNQKLQLFLSMRTKIISLTHKAKSRMCILSEMFKRRNTHKNLDKRK